MAFRPSAPLTLRERDAMEIERVLALWATVILHDRFLGVCLRNDISSVDGERLATR